MQIAPSRVCWPGTTEYYEELTSTATIEESLLNLVETSLSLTLSKSALADVGGRGLSRKRIAYLVAFITVLVKGVAFVGDILIGRVLPRACVDL